VNGEDDAAPTTYGIAQFVAKQFADAKKRDEDALVDKGLERAKQIVDAAKKKAEEDVDVDDEEYEMHMQHLQRFFNARGFEGMPSDENGVIDVTAAVMDWSATDAAVGSDPEDGGPDDESFIPPEDMIEDAARSTAQQMIYENRAASSSASCMAVPPKPFGGQLTTQVVRLAYTPPQEAAAWSHLTDGIVLDTNGNVDFVEETIRVSTAVMDVANTDAAVRSDPGDGGQDDDTFIPPEDDDMEESGGIEDTSDESAWGNDFLGRSSGWQPPQDGNR
jgi:hypothetical protein